MPQQALAHAPSKTILLIEPDENHQRARTALLAAAGYAVECAGDRTEACTLCAARHYDLIVAECVSRSNGRFTAAEPLTKELPGQRILLLLGADAVLCPVFSEGVLVLRREGTEGFLDRIVDALERDVPPS